MNREFHYSLAWLSYELGIPGDVLCELAASAETHYRPFYKYKKGNRRLIDNPDCQLKAVQTEIRNRLLAPLPLSLIVHGCVKRRSAFTNAHVHTKARNLASIDVKRFYPNVTNRMVYALLRDRLRLGPDLARLLTLLTTRLGHLPHGAPTSDAIANLVLAPLDDQIEQLASDLDLRASRYLDNIDLAGVRAREAIGPVIVGLRKIGLAVRHGKTRNAGPRSPHIVTGLGVTSTNPSATRRDRDDVRIATYALIAAKQRGENIFELKRSVRGSIAHIAMTNPGSATRLKRQLLKLGGIRL